LKAIPDTRWRTLLLVVAALAGIAVTVSLGQWQLGRAQQKLDLQKAMDAQAGKVAIGADTLRQQASSPELLYQPAKLQGRWLPEHTIFLDNRQMNAKVGYFVITPLALDGGGVILVQRGWAPRNFVDRNRLPEVTTAGGDVQVAGRIAPAPGKLYEFGSTSRGAIRQNIDMVEFASQTGLVLLPITLQQHGASDEGLARDWPPVNLGVDKHYGYAFQWFGIATLLAGLTLWFQVIRRYLISSEDAHPDV
jgi:surfeit locus 1 family protein